MGYLELDASTKAGALNEILSSREAQIGPHQWSMTYCVAHLFTTERDDPIIWLVSESRVLYDGVPARAPIRDLYCVFIDQGGPHWSAKFIHELDGPSYWSCPLDFLELATPFNEQWRAEVQQFHQGIKDVAVRHPSRRGSRNGRRTTR